MAELTDAALDAALERGRVARVTEPRARRARYDHACAAVVVDLANGSSFTFPTALASGLADATAGQLAQIEILGDGYGLHWEALDVDISIPGLLADLFGTKTHMARRGGQATSPAKAAAARKNGAKGGRPRKLAPA